MAMKKQTANAAPEMPAAEIGAAAALQAELDKALAEIQVLHDELAAGKDRIASLERLLDAGLAPGGVSEGDTATPEAISEFAAGKNPPPDDAEVVAIKSRHGHAFWRAGYQVQPVWTFIRRADFEPADFTRLIADRMVEAREALLPQGEAE